MIPSRAGGRGAILGVVEPDPYRILGLSPGVAPEEVDQAWRRAARETHPDRGGDAGRFRLARWAHLSIVDPGRAGRYPADAATPGRHRTDVLRVPLGAAMGGGLVAHAGRRVRVPADIAVGEELRLVGLGEPGDPPGDLLLRVEVHAVPPWTLDGLEVSGPLPLTWLELYRGRAVQVFLPGGRSATLRVGPELLTVDDPVVFRVRGLGLRRGEERGDLLLRPLAVAPTSGDATLESVLVRLQQGRGEELRRAAMRMEGADG